LQGALATLLDNTKPNQTSTRREIPAGPDYAATVAAMNQNLEAISREVALRIGELSSGLGR
jgi:hypothetical protein